MNKAITILFCSLLGSGAAACAADTATGDPGADAGQPAGADAGQPAGDVTYSYQTTSNVGDLATWELTGSDLVVEWLDIAPLTGAVERTYDLAALCGSENATFGYRTCLIDSSMCTPGTEACKGMEDPQQGETLNIFEIPGVALVVEFQGQQLHSGFAAGQCSDVPTDDYSYVNVGLGQEEIFGVFRTDADFSTVHHMDFGYSDGPDGQISYTTNDPAGLVQGISVSPCANGVRELTVEGDGLTQRMVLTAAGHFILDKPEGEGGLIAINSQNAATIADFADREFGGIAFPDDRAPEFLNVTMGPDVGGRVQVLSIELSDSGVTPLETPVYLNDGATGAKLGEDLLEPGAPYASNAIISGGDYTNGPTEIPGIFELDQVSGDETTIVGVGAAVNGKAILFGVVVNEHEENRNGVKGNFILVEK